MEEKFRHKLDLYYLATIGYGATLILYVMVTGFWIDDRFELVWKDPIVYLLAFCAGVSVLALIVAAVLHRRVIVRDRELILRTRFKDRVFRPEEIAWIAVRPEPRTAPQRAYPAVVLKLQNRRRRLHVRPGAFEHSEQLLKSIKEWAGSNNVEVRDRRRITKRRGDSL